MTNPQGEMFAVIDMGSNSFHMLIAKYMAGGVHTIGRVKRKVRLAAGLNQENVLSEEAMKRGWECLALFAERLQDIPKQNIKIVATATLRLATNANIFIEKAEQVLAHKISVISGEEEACTIYKGVAHTSACQGKQLVIDIGGASTEVVIGQGFDAHLFESLNMGCVTFLERYFQDGQLTDANFSNAIAAAHQIILPIADKYKAFGWELAVGASGTVQAIQEIFSALGESDQLTLDKLLAIKARAVSQHSIESLSLPGLVEERRLVFVSGLAILIALFESLDITKMGLAGGALREGVLFSMIPALNTQDIRSRTLKGLTERFHIDKEQAERVAELSCHFLRQVEHESDEDGFGILTAAANLHEIGLIIDYKNYHQHSAYMLRHSAMPGYTKVQKALIVALLQFHREDLPTEQLISAGCHRSFLELLVRILRLSVLFSMRRKDDVLPELALTVDKSSNMTVRLPEDWLLQHPLMNAELTQEIKYQNRVGWALEIKVD